MPLPPPFWPRLTCWPAPINDNPSRSAGLRALVISNSGGHHHGLQLHDWIARMHSMIAFSAANLELDGERNSAQRTQDPELPPDCSPTTGRDKVCKDRSSNAQVATQRDAYKRDADSGTAQSQR